MASLEAVMERSSDTRFGVRIFNGEVPIFHKGDIMYAQIFFPEDGEQLPGQILAADTPKSSGNAHIPYQEVEFLTVEKATTLIELQGRLESF